jgi:hypothetical protein
MATRLCGTSKAQLTSVALLAAVSCALAGCNKSSSASSGGAKAVAVPPGAAGGRRGVRRLVIRGLGHLLTDLSPK